MNRKEQIIFMQARLIRLASEKWNMPYEEVVELFRRMNVYEYIEDGFGIFGCEGDEVILEDIEELLKNKNINIEKL